MPVGKPVALKPVKIETPEAVLVKKEENYEVTDSVSRTLRSIGVLEAVVIPTVTEAATPAKSVSVAQLSMIPLAHVLAPNAQDIGPGLPGVSVEGRSQVGPQTIFTQHGEEIVQPGNLLRSGVPARITGRLAPGLATTNRAIREVAPDFHEARE